MRRPILWELSQVLSFLYRSKLMPSMWSMRSTMGSTMGSVRSTDRWRTCGATTQGFQLLSQYSSTYTSSHFRSGFSTFKSFGLQVFSQLHQLHLLGLLSNHANDSPHLHLLQISLQFLGSWKIRTQAQKLRPARWVLAPMRSATSWEQMVRRKNTVPKCLNPKMPNAKYMSIYLLSMSQNPKLIQHKRGPIISSIATWIMSPLCPSTLQEQQHHSVSNAQIPKLPASGFVSDLLSLPRSFTFNPIGRQTLAV